MTRRKKRRAPAGGQRRQRLYQGSSSAMTMASGGVGAAALLAACLLLSGGGGERGRGRGVVGVGVGVGVASSFTISSPATGILRRSGAAGRSSAAAATATARAQTGRSTRRYGVTFRTPSELASPGDENDHDDDDGYAPPSNIYDVVICGAGPGGLLLASSLSSLGCSVSVVDPILDRPWPNNYGVWMDEALEYGFGDCVDRVWNEVGIVFDENTEELTLDRPYGRVDRKAMKTRLMEECRKNGVTFGAAKAIDLIHYDDGRPSEVTVAGKGKDGEADTAKIRALLTIDATGFSRKFVKHDAKFDPGYQNTYGARFRVKDLGPYTKDKMILMDYSEMHLHDDPEMVKSNNRFPSFVYVMPLADDELFLEETVLVSRPGAPWSDLEARLYKRMEKLGIEPLEVLEDERAAIPMGGADPAVPQRTLGFGATSSLVHPASGYMVARAMEIAPRLAASLAPGLKDLRSKLERGESLSGQDLDDVSASGWDAVWPTDERRQRDFMHFGFELLCLLDPQGLRDFFTGFFRLPNALWEHFLSWRLSGVGHVVMGLTVWATCIPRRFMPVMLVKSLPFLADKLVFPFVSRGNYAPIETKIYYDANGNSKKWEPEEYYSRDYKAVSTEAGAKAKGEARDAETESLTVAPTPREDSVTGRY